MPPRRSGVHFVKGYWQVGMDIREKERISEGTEISFKLSLMKMKAGQEYMRLYPEK